MESATLLLLPLAAFAALALAGAGLAAWAGAGLPADARAALAPLLGAAVFVCVTPVVTLGVPVAVVGAVALGGPALATFVALRGVRPLVRAALAPLAAAALPFALAAAPWFAARSWNVAALGNVDLYLWTSQARALLDGPVRGPVGLHPDRLAFERIGDQGWAVALPVGDALLALGSGSAPEEVYGALVPLLAALVALAAYVLARTCLGWSAAWSAAGAVLVGANATLLHAAYFGWHGQLLGTAFLVVAAAGLARALARDGGRMQWLAALGAAAALGAYRLPIAPVLALTLGALLVADAATRRSAGNALRVARGTGLRFALLGAGSLVPLALGLPRFLSSNVEEAALAPFRRAPIAQTLGLVPIPLEPGAEEPIGMTVAATALALAALAAGFVLALRSRDEGRRAVAAVALAVGASALVLAAPPFQAYLSMKLLAYGAPFLVLLAALPAVTFPRPAVRLAGVAALALALAATATIGDRGVRFLRGVPALDGLTAAAQGLPKGSVVSVEVADGWTQSWAIYALRETRLSVAQPSAALVGMGSRRRPEEFLRPASHVLGYDTGASGALWRGAGLELRRDT